MKRYKIKENIDTQKIFNKTIQILMDEEVLFELMGEMLYDNAENAIAGSFGQLLPDMLKKALYLYFKKHEKDPDKFLELDIKKVVTLYMKNLKNNIK